MKGVILHGGHGTRLRPLTHTGPKQLIPVANKPISQYVLEDLRNSGIKDIAIILGDIMPEKVKEYYGDGSNFGVNITYIHQEKPAGIAHAVGLTEDFVKDDTFIVYLGDNLLKGGIAKITKEFQQKNCDALTLLSKVDNPQQFGVAEFDKKGNLVRLIEKPKKPPSNYALTGIYFFTPKIFKMIKKLKPSWRGELEITEAIQLLLEEGYKLDYRIVEGWWKDTGTIEDIMEANILVLDELEPKMEGTVEDKTCIQGRVSIGKNTCIKNGALIRGPSIMGENTIIEGEVYIGPYTSIGNNTKIRRGEIENSIIMDNCTIEINTKITDSIIGANSEIIANQKVPKGHKLIVGENSKIVF
ncbi:MAG TPA: glucose-1-phosphate thymidylyltransferase [Candidatus Bathyarchaeia archaeon]|nr:glucose-1-phosphate thymidylyltransferase [Candidatus Bathyarchaeia archaeon]